MMKDQLKNPARLIVLIALWVLAQSSASFAEDVQRCWVFFRDKGITAGQVTAALDRAQANLTDRALSRRAKNRALSADAYDVPLCESHVSQIRSTGARIRTGSKWLNAVSVEATLAQLQAIHELPCVQRVQPFTGRRANLSSPRSGASRRRCSIDDPNYGLSYTQNQLCRVPELHARGLSGRGILLCVLDTGFETRHESLDSVNVIGQYDFIFGDTIVTNQAGQDSADQFLHGTAVLSAMGGNQDGILVGPAYGADYLLAKTEWVSDETPIEEDYYVAAMEWADSIGADITSSSLGYINWYTFDDMDGRTAVTTIAVNVATQHGILVCTAGGNERGSWWNHIIAPADADSILAVGAVDSLRQLAGFSSPGPTADGRIKPDVCAMGVDVMCADAWDFNHYWFWGGTSLATPIVAGVAALIMEAHPEWTAQQVRTALLQTGSRHQNPDNDFGWGIVDGVEAADYVFDNAAAPRAVQPLSPLLLSSYPNPVNGSAEISLTVPSSGGGVLRLYDALGRMRQTWTRQYWNAGEHRLNCDVSKLATGIYWLRYEGTAGRVSRSLVVVK